MEAFIDYLNNELESLYDYAQNYHLRSDQLPEEFGEYLKSLSQKELLEFMGYVVDDGLKPIKRATALRKMIDRILEQCNVRENAVGQTIWLNSKGGIFTVTPADYYERIKKAVQQDSQLLEDDISALKKRIKHAKNPLEKRNLEKQLNIAYKKRKTK